MSSIKNRTASFVVIIIIYLAAIAAGAATLSTLAAVSEINPFFAVFLADLAATAVVYVSSILLENASVYDPYWSVIPVFIVLAIYWQYNISFAFEQLLVLLPLSFWAVRLTYNWARGFENLEWEDWRYRKFRAQYPKAFLLISFFGIMLMPTIMVYLGMMPVFLMLSAARLSVFHVLSGLIIAFAAVYQMIADRQMREFRSANKGTGKCINSGLWKYSRHPNYFGEVTIWWGVAAGALANLPALSFGLNKGMTWLITLLGATTITCLFVFISIPLMERHIIDSRPDYSVYKESVKTVLIPNIFRKGE